MRTGTVVGSVVGSAVVYLVVAACGSSHDQTIVVVGGGVEDVVDAITSPEGEAAANTPMLDVADETCQPIGSVGQRVATHQYPGRTANELSTVRLLVSTSSAPGTSDGTKYVYTLRGDGALVKDGQIAYDCGATTGGPADVVGVRFVLPL